MKHEKEKKPQNRDGLKQQLIVLVRYSVTISHALCDAFIAFLFAVYSVSLPHSSVVEYTVRRRTRIPILVCLAVEDIRKGLSVQTY